MTIKESNVCENEYIKLNELVKQYKVCFEVGPEYHVCAYRDKLQIGYNLYIIGTHYEPKEVPLPGCKECRKVHKHLKEIAEWVIPQEERDCRYEIRNFDNSIRYATKRKHRKDIILTLKILHRERFDRPVDSCEILCLEEMKEKLKKLGVKKGDWDVPTK